MQDKTFTSSRGHTLFVVKTFPIIASSDSFFNQLKDTKCILSRMSESPVKGIPLREAETRLGELFQYEFNQVQFASRSDIHRAKIISANNGAQLWVENKKTKQQWQAIITNVSECGPAGVPSEAVLTFLKVMLSLRFWKSLWTKYYRKHLSLFL